MRSILFTTRLHTIILWNSAEKAQFKDFDFSRLSMYNGISSSQLLRIYAPFCAPLNPNIKKYQIRVLYANSDTDPLYIGSKMWCIHQLNATREGRILETWKYFDWKTRTWNKSKVGFIEYVYPQEHQLNTERRAQVFLPEDHQQI